jgi:hypothetical protein
MSVQHSDMPLIDPDDDSLQRYAVWHYRDDPSRGSAGTSRS